MKILYLLPAFTFGGAERFLINLVSGHADRFEVVVLTFRRMEPHLRDLNCRLVWLEDIGVSERDLEEIFFRKNFVRALRVTWCIYSVIRCERPMLSVGVQHISAFLLAIARDFFWMKTPYVANLHGDASAYLQREVSSPFHRFVNRLLLRYLCNRASAIIVPSLGVRDDLIGRFHVQPEKTHAIYNGLDLKLIHERSERLLDNAALGNSRPVILGVGRLDTQKSLQTLISAFTEVLKRTPAKLVILGEGPERSRLEQHIFSLGIQESVTLAGFVDNPYQWMAKAAVFCLSSTYEGFGLVLVEAMACGCPVVSTDCPSGPGEIIHHEENGMLVPVGDSVAMADAIRQILLDGQFRNKLIQAGLRRANDFTIPEMVTRYEVVYQGILPASGTMQEQHKYP